MKKILITGTTGFIGRNLYEYFRHSYNVLAPTHKELDLLNGDAVSKFLEKNKVNYIIHTANCNNTKRIAKDYEILDGNLRMFFNLANNNNLYERMLYFGSGAEYDRETMPPMVDENMFGRYLPMDPYGFSKYTMSKLAEAYDNIYDLILFGVYGRYEEWHRRFISNAICRCIFDMPITLQKNVYFDYLHVSDLCKIVEKMLGMELKYKRYNVTTGKAVDLLSIAKMVQIKSGKNPDILVAEEGMKNEYTASNARLMEELGEYVFSELDRNIEDLFNYYYENKEIINPEKLI